MGHELQSVTMYKKAVKCRSCAVAFDHEFQSVRINNKANVYSSELQKLCCRYRP